MVGAVNGHDPRVQSDSVANSTSAPEPSTEFEIVSPLSSTDSTTNTAIVPSTLDDARADESDSEQDFVPLARLELSGVTADPDFVPSSLADCILSSLPSLPAPSPPSLPPVGPQRASTPVCIAASQDEHAGAGSRSPVAGDTSDGIAADGGGVGQCEAHEEDGGRDGSEEQSDVEIIKAVVYKAPRAPSRSLQLPEFDGLPHTPHALYTLGGGRCSIAAPMLAMGRLPDSHANHHCQARIDAERIRLGESMQEPVWSEDKWIRTVPISLRMERAQTGWHRDESKRTAPVTSYVALRQALLDPAANQQWLELSVFYLVAELYDVGVFIVQMFAERGSKVTYFRHIQPSAKQHIIVYFADGHYQCVQYQQQRLFPSTHPFVQRLLHLCISHAPPVAQEADFDLQILAERAAQPPPAASVASCVPAPPQRGYLSSSSDALGESLPSVAAIAAHPPLYNVVSFRNVPMWVGANTPLWNAYRVASERGDRAAQVRAVLDILLLPSFVLSRTGRGGRGAAQRKARTINARCRSRVAAAVQRYGRTVPYESNGEVQAIAGPPAARSRQPAASRVSIATTDSDDNECTAPAVRRQTATKAVSSRTRSSVQRLFEQPGDDQDVDAVNSAKRLVTEKQIRRAAQRLHSTTAMVDLTDATVRAELVNLHPPLPEGAMIPARPGGTSPIILEDDDDMRRLLRSSNNGSAGGPSGWAGNMLSSLVESALCRAGIITLLSDIVNNNLPDQARQYLLSSRLVGLSKPDSGVRPIAIGEVFYRLAAVLAVRRVTAAASALLVPHQYGIGVASGAERILHSMQHTLTDKQRRLAALKCDISNAFNCCNRALLLEKLYGTPELSALYNIADFAYSTPSTLLLERADGDSIQSSNGVRQGDPLSTLLFCLYMRDVYVSVAKAANVTLYAFVDDLHVVGEPAEVLKALASLETALPAVSLECNTSKSQFAYFYGDQAPLKKAALDTLAGLNITVHEQHMEVVGAVVGRDKQAVRDGLAEVRQQTGNDAFFRRLLLDEMPVQSAMLLLRQCMVPQLNYLLRCTPPSCIANTCAEFDAQVLAAAVDKLDLSDDDAAARDTARLLRGRLKDGGFGLTSAALTSPGAYLGSLAAARSAVAFAPYSAQSSPLPVESLLHEWIAQSMTAVTARTPSNAQYLPATAASFFSHYFSTSKAQKLALSLQRTLNAQATQHSFDASLSRARTEKAASRTQDGLRLFAQTTRRLAHLRSISAPMASMWKQAVPSTASLTLLDSQYRLAARLNLDLAPLRNMAPLPEQCPTCEQPGVFSDMWHCLICSSHTSGRGGVARRHHAVNRALCETAWTLGGQADMEVQGLLPGSRLRPDLRLVFHGEHLLSDVQINHPLAPSYVSRVAGGKPMTVARASARNKRNKYERMRRHVGATFIPFVADSFGGLSDDALQLVGRMADAAQQHMWQRDQIVRHVLSNVAVAIQRGERGHCVGWSRGHRLQSTRHCQVR